MGNPTRCEPIAIDPQLKGILRLPFCEHNLILPIHLDGRKLTVLAAHPESLNVASAVAILKSRYDVDVVMAPEAQIRAAIDANYYGKCETCGAKVDFGQGQCAQCKLRPPEPPAPVPVVQPPAVTQQPGYAGTQAAGPGVVGKTCPYCQFPIKDSSRLVLCPGCGIPHHEECWQANGGCTTFGCTSGPTGAPGVHPTHTQPQQAAPQHQMQAPAAVLRRQPWGRAAAIAVVSVVALLVLIVALAQPRGNRPAFPPPRESPTMGVPTGPADSAPARSASTQYREDARTVLVQLERVEARLEVGINLVNFSELMGDVHASVLAFQRKYDYSHSSDGAYEALCDADEAYTNSVSLWAKKIDAEVEGYSYLSNTYEEQMQDLWERASVSLSRARSALTY